MASRSATSVSKPRRPVGRPRGDGKPHLTRQRVFETCTKLIAQHGFAGTSIRMMATALDASPASLFNLFGSKDGLLNQLIAYAAQGSLAFHQAIRAVKAAPEALLYKSIFEEVIVVASADQDFAGIFYLPELRKPEFEAAQAIRARMVAHYADLLAQCVQTGRIETDNVALVAEQVFQLTETSILAPQLSDAMSPEQQAAATADFCLRGLGLGVADLRAIRQAAADIPLSIELPEG